MNYFPPYPEHRFGIFRCPHCRKAWTPLHDTIFRKSRISCVQFMTLALGWLLKDTNKGQAQSTSISNRSVSTFTLKMNAFAEATLKRQHQKLGGLMHVVEIDEALLHRRKYNRGRAKDSGWILGGIERPTSERPVPRAFLVECPDRKQETLEKIIQENVEPGTIILTDSFRSYLHISRLGYYHYMVNHSKNFVDPKTKAHTQRIEGFWQQVRKNAIPRTGVPLYLLGSYMAAFLYRRQNGQDLECFLQDLKTTTYDEVEEIMASYNEKKKESEGAAEDEN